MPKVFYAVHKFKSWMFFFSSVVQTLQIKQKKKKKKKKQTKKKKKKKKKKKNITKTCIYNFNPLKPHLYIEKLGFTGVYIIFLIFA